MKVRIKFSQTQKFVITLKENKSTYGDLQEAVSTFILENYNHHINNLLLSFNGKEAINASKNDPLIDLGIVNGDLLIVFKNENIESPSSNPVVSRTSEADMSSSRSNIEGERSITGSNIEAVKDNRTISNVINLLDVKDEDPPPIILEIFEQYSPSSASQALNLLIHTIMVDSGFYIQDGTSSKTNTLPDSWKDMVATIKYHNPGFINFNCTIAIVTMGTIKQVLASFEGQETEISVRLEIKDYLPSTQVSPHQIIKVSHLTRVLRNQLLYPLQIAVHEMLGLPAPWHLAGLPQEILILIGSYLDIDSILKITVSCKRLLSAFNDNKLWLILFKRDFKNKSHSSDKISDANWKNKYKEAYISKKKNLSQEPLPIYNPYIPNPLNPGIPYPHPVPYPDPNPYVPQPYGPQPYYPQPDPFWDPDSPYFGGEIPLPNPAFPLGGGRLRPRQPLNPLHPGFFPSRGNPNGPRFL